MFTIVTRTANRPRFFAECRRSVLEQTIQPHHLVISDTPADTYPEGDTVIRVQHLQGRGHNLYFNTARPHIPATHPWVVFLDDDDAFTRPDALEILAKKIQWHDDLLLWQVQFGERIIPGNDIFLPPAPGNISGIGFCYHISKWVDWTGDSYGDWRVINELYNRLSPRWIDVVLTGLQAGVGHGERQDIPL